MADQRLTLDPNQTQPLATAAGAGDLEACKQLAKDRGLTTEDARAPDLYPDGTPCADNAALRFAAENGHLAVCKWLAATFALGDKDARAGCNYPLRGAASRGHLAVCKWLAETFDLDERNSRASIDDSLRWAMYGGHSETVTWLVGRFDVTASEIQEAEEWIRRMKRRASESTYADPFL